MTRLSAWISISREEPDTTPDSLYVVGYTMSGDFSGFR